MIQTFPWLSFIALSLGYMALLITTAIVIHVGLELFKDWRVDRDISQRVNKIDEEMRKRGGGIV